MKVIAKNKNTRPYSRLVRYVIYLFIPGMMLTGCMSDMSSESVGSTDTGIAGSYARFITVGDFLYIVDRSSLQTYSLSDPSLPQRIHTQDVGSQVESIFRHEDKLFVGSGQGLFIYTIPADGIPILASATDYDFPILPCDPVVANDTYAYVTLHDQDAGGPCGGWNNVNELKIFDITDIYNPQELIAYPMFKPKGVGIDGTTLFVCDDLAGLKIFDVSDPMNMQPIAEFTHFQAFDVIPLDGLLLCVGTDNVYQFDYSDLGNIQELSRIPIQS
jgi:hypothetical protein